MINTYSKSKDGNAYITKNLKIKEFACKDGADKILIDTDLAEGLQKIREHFNAPLTITSGYRTPSHNAAVGGSPRSQHVKGTAADIKVKGVPAVEVATYAQTIFNGVGCYYYGSTDFCHVDTRSGVKHWLCARKGKYNYFSYSFMPTVRKGYNPGEKDAAVRFLQKKLKLNIDGKFGSGTERTIKEFQSKHGLTADGIVGKNTWKTLF